MSSSAGTGEGVRFTNPIYNVPEAIPEQESEIPELLENENPTQRSNPLFDVESSEKVLSLSKLREELEPTEMKSDEVYEKKGELENPLKTTSTYSEEINPFVTNGSPEDNEEKETVEIESLDAGLNIFNELREEAQLEDEINNLIDED